MDYEKVNMDEQTEEDLIYYAHETELIFKLNHTLPRSDEYIEIMNELLDLDENSFVMAPIAGAALNKVKIGKNVYINSNSLLMVRGGITINCYQIIMMSMNVIF